MNRRDFLKAAGIGTAATVAASCTGHGSNVSGGAAKPVEGKVASRNFGDETGLLGYGCMRWPTNKQEDGNEVIDQEQVNALVDYALEHGVNYFDSSPVYLQGKSEEASATALMRHPRDSYYIATKASVFREPVTYEQGVEMYRKSLEIYHTDHIDYYLLHALADGQDLKDRFIDNGLLDFFMKERELGHIRKLGFSFHGKEDGFDELMEMHEKYHWDFVQIQMNYLDWTHPGSRDSKAEYLYRELDRLEIPIVIMEPLRGGTLANIPATLADRLKAIEPDRSIASWAFRFCGTFPRVLTVLSGMTYMDHLQDNLQSFIDFKPLKENELSLLEEIAGTVDKFPLIRCTGCKYCMPCPYGLDIPGIFKFYNNAINDDSYIVSSDQKHYKAAKRSYLARYEKAVPKERQADHCISCGKCVKRCPQHIRIPREMRRIDEYVENLKQNKL